MLCLFRERASVMVAFIRVYSRLGCDMGNFMGVLQVYMDGQFDVDFRETLGIDCLLWSICLTPPVRALFSSIVLLCADPVIPLFVTGLDLAARKGTLHFWYR